MSSAQLRAGIIIAGMIGLAGCQSDSARQDAPIPLSREALLQYAQQQCTSLPPDMSKADCEYLSQMQYGIRHQFTDYEHYLGRECELVISWGIRGRYSVLSTHGDEALCKKAWGMVGSAENLPPPPEGFPHRFIINFKPAA